MNEKATNIRIPPKGTRGSRMMEGPRILRPIMNAVMGRQVRKYQGTKGPEPAKFMGFPVLLLTTVGAKTGAEHTHVLGGFPDGKDSWLVIASKGGAPTHPHWFINLAKNPDKVWAQVGDQRFRARVESLEGNERNEAYDRVVAVAKNYAGYRTKTDREIPVVRVTKAE
jgi:deazaflavin-dependent oxidoreductase (nitroreductase family)